MVPLPAVRDENLPRSVKLAEPPEGELEAVTSKVPSSLILLFVYPVVTPNSEHPPPLTLKFVVTEVMYSEKPTLKESEPMPERPSHRPCRLARAWLTPTIWPATRNVVSRVVDASLGPTWTVKAPSPTP